MTKSASASQLPPKSKVAEEKIPADLESAREVGSPNPALKAPMPPPERVRPDLKHMTAKMQRSLTFGQSDEVEVSPPAASPSFTADTTAIRDLPVQGRALEPKSRGAGQTAAATTLTANAFEEKDKSGFALVHEDELAPVESRNRALAKAAALKPHLAGTVFDASGARVPNAKVTTVGPVATETVTSDAQGRFAFDVLTPGQYSVKAEASGFNPTELKQVAIAANQSPSLELKLTPGAVAETVEVSAPSAVVESSATDGNASAEAGAMAKKEQKTQGNGRAASRKNAVAAMVPALGWTLSPGGAVESSADGGKTWQTVAVADNASFQALSAVGASVWVGGSGGILYHSLNAGRNWTAVVPGTQGNKLNSDITRIEFLDSRDGSLSTSNGEIWITHDGGNTWERN